MFTFKSVIIVFIIVKCSCSKSPLQGRNAIRGTKLTCPNPNLDYFEEFTCSVKLINRTYQLYNIGGIIKPNISVNWVHVKITSYYKFSVIYRKLLINLDEDICSMLAGTVEGVMLGNDVMAENFNVVEGCPYKTGPLYLRGLRIKHGQLSDILPTGNWRLDLQFYTRDRARDISLFNLKFFFEVKYQAIRNAAVNYAYLH